MARTIEEINKSLQEAFVNNEYIVKLYGGNPDLSKASVERVLLYNFAVVCAAMESLFDWFRQDVTQIVENERYGYAGWYERMARLFRYGEGIYGNYDYSTTGSFAESAVYPGEIPDNIDELQVVKHVFAEDNPQGFGVSIKVAGEKDGKISKLSSGQEAAFINYITRIKPAGIPVSVINEPAETLTVRLQIWVDPLIINADINGGGGGDAISGGEKVVETAVKSYLKSIEFNGEFIAMKLVDAIQLVPGVRVVHFGGATAKAGIETKAIEERYKPHSGYMEINLEGSEISYEI